MLYHKMMNAGRHKVFEKSFNAKECQSIKFFLEKIKYIHHNPVSKRWRLVNDFTDFRPPRVLPATNYNIKE